MAAVLDADTLVGAAVALWDAYLEALGAIFLESYLSLFVAFLVFLMLFGLARSGGVGAIRHMPAHHTTGRAVRLQQQQQQAALSQQQQRIDTQGTAGSKGQAGLPGDRVAKSAAPGSTGAGAAAATSTSAVVDSPQPLVLARVGGLGMQLLFAGLHTLAHLSTAGGAWEHALGWLDQQGMAGQLLVLHGPPRPLQHGN